MSQSDQFGRFIRYNRIVGLLIIGSNVHLTESIRAEIPATTVLTVRSLKQTFEPATLYIVIR